MLINDLLASGEIPDLFPEDEVENIINGMRNEVKSMGLYDSKENCWRVFIDRVRKNLKVVFHINLYSSFFCFYFVARCESLLMSKRKNKVQR